MMDGWEGWVHITDLWGLMVVMVVQMSTTMLRWMAMGTWERTRFQHMMGWRFDIMVGNMRWRS